MPELPEVAAIADFLDERMAGLPIRRIDVASLSVLKTAAPPYSDLIGRTVGSVGRIGKYLVVTAAAGPDEQDRHLVIHLSRAGWVRWSENLSPHPPRPGGKGPIALRVHCGLPGEGFDVTEAGTQKRLAVWVVADPYDVAPIAGLGPDALSCTRAELAAVLAGSTARIKNLLTDQRALAGIGNAYSDEILHRARLSPFATAKSLSDEQATALHGAIGEVLRDARERLDGPGGVSMMKAEKRSGLAVHARTGLPCPVCGDTVAEVSFAERSFQYCPTCQTGGKKLADRRMSRLLK